MDLIKYAEDEIHEKYNDKASVGGARKSLLKFGLNPDVDTALETIQELVGAEVHETFVSTNIIDAIITDDAANTQDIVVEGCTIDGSGDFTFVSQTATLTGLTKVVLGTPLARVYRAYNNSGTALAASSTVYVYDDTAGETTGVPNTDAAVKLVITDTYNQSQKCSYTVDKNQYLLISQVWTGINKITTISADMFLEVRLKGGVFRTQLNWGVGTAGATTGVVPLNPFLIIPPNSDIRVTGESSAVNGSISACFSGMLAQIYEDN